MKLSYALYLAESSGTQSKTCRLGEESTCVRGKGTNPAMPCAPTVEVCKALLIQELTVELMAAYPQIEFEFNWAAIEVGSWTSIFTAHPYMSMRRRGSQSQRTGGRSYSRTRLWQRMKR